VLSGSDVVLDHGDSEQGVKSGSAYYVSDNYFRLLDVRPVLGAGLPSGSAADFDNPPLVAVINHRMWDQQFGRSAAVLGKTLAVNGVQVTIVGVAPPDFVGTSENGSSKRIWLPLAARSAIEQSGPAAFTSRDSTYFNVVARLQPGGSAEQANPVVRAIAARSESKTQTRDGIRSADVVPLLLNNEAPAERAELAFAIATASVIGLLILLVTCSNVSALAVGAAVTRRREIAVRLSLGAERARLIRQLLTESVLLAGAAGVLGLVVVWIVLSALNNRVFETAISLDWQAFVFTFATALGAGVLFGVSPALHATRLATADVLKESATAVAASRSLLQRGLVVTQIALTQPLLVGLGAGVLVVMQDLRGRPEQSAYDRIVTINVDNWAGNPSREQNIQGMLRLQERLRAVPGVVNALAYRDGTASYFVSVHPDDRVVGTSVPENLRISLRDAPPGYFDLMGIPLVRGRDFSASIDTLGSMGVVIASDAARALFGVANPIGRRLVSVNRGRGGQSSSSGRASIELEKTARETELVVVGVVDERATGNTLSASNEVSAFQPTGLNWSRLGWTRTLLVRTRGPGEAMIPLLRSVIRAEAPQRPISRATTLAAMEARTRANFLRGSSIAGAAALLTLFLSAIGLYAVVAFAVAQRTREIGIRTALGAQRQQVVGFFFLRGLRLSALGLIFGLPLSLLGLRMWANVERGVADADPTLLTALIVLLVLAIASLATWLPARRAASIDPLVALRTE
jgi:predicted permease